MGLLHRVRWGLAVEQWVDEELGPVRSNAVLVHVVDCPDCLDDVRSLARLKRTLAGLEPR